jgi:hypothetical protein
MDLELLPQERLRETALTLKLDLNAERVAGVNHHAAFAA